VRGTRASRDAPSAEATLTVPPDSRYLSVLRTAAAGLAAHLDFTLDDIEDLRIAVDEACALLLEQASPDASLRCEFGLTGHALTVRASAECDQPAVPSRDGFSWTVLSALTSGLAMAADSDELVITFARVRGHTQRGVDS
jgi:serine/threonine-protein kinase RsbW